MRLIARRHNPPAEKATARKLDIFVIDTGRDVAMSELLRTEGIGELGMQHRVFVLSQQQSSDVIGKSKQLVGQDPMLVLLNSDARVEKRSRNYGIRLCLGGLDAAQAKVLLQRVAETASAAEKSGDEMIAELSNLACTV